MESEHSIPTFALGEGGGGPSKCKRMPTERWGGVGVGGGFFSTNVQLQIFVRCIQTSKKKKEIAIKSGKRSGAVPKDYH